MRNMINILSWPVDSGFNCYIDIHPACNAHCQFCIAPTIGRQTSENFWDGVEFGLDFTHQVKGTLQIVGGEPTISKRLPELLKRIGRLAFRRIVLNTNATLITPLLIRQCKENGVTHINISRHHYRSEKNQEVMLMKPHLSNESLIRSINLIKEYDINARIQCNLIPGYIDSAGEIDKYLDWTKSIGIDNISFSQLFRLDQLDYQVELVKDYTRNNQVDLVGIVKAISNDLRFTDAPRPIDATAHGGGPTTAWGKNKRRYWHDQNRHLRFSIKTMIGYDINELPIMIPYNKSNDEELLDGQISFAVIQADGLVSASWDRNERVLYDPLLGIDSPLFQKGKTEKSIILAY